MRSTDALGRIAHALLLALTLSAPGRLTAAQPDETASPTDAVEDSPPIVGSLAEYVTVDGSAVPASNSIATKMPSPIGKTPAHVGVVAEPLLSAQRARTLSDGLRNVGGVHVVDGLNVFDYFIIRGFDVQSSGLVMTDGAAEPESTVMPTYNVEAIEVFKGPAGFLYGKDPLGGAVNVVRKQALPVNAGRFTASTGSFGTADSTIDWNLSDVAGRKAFRVNGLYGESDGWRDRSDSRQVAVNPAFAWRPTPDQSLQVNAEYVDAEFRPDVGLPLLSTGDLPRVPRERNYQTPLDFSDQEILRLQTDYERRFDAGPTLRIKAYHRELDWLTDGTLYNGILGSTVSRTFTTLDDRQRFSGLQVEGIFSVRTGSVGHRLLAGVEVARQTDEFDLGILPPDGFFPPGSMIPTMPSIDLFDPVETFAASFAFPFVSGDSRATILAPYVIDEIQVADRATLVAGLRFDEISTDLSFSDNQQEPGRANSSVDRDDSEFSPMLGLVVETLENWTVYASASRAHAPIGARVVGAAELEPERATQSEAGIRYSAPDDRLRATVAIYDADRSNLAITGDNGFTQQAGDQRSRGVELELAVQPVPRLRLLFSYAYNDAEFTEFNQLERVGPGPTDFAVRDRTGNRPAFAPEHLAQLWVNHRFESGFALSGGARVFSGQFIAEDNQVEIDGALVIDGALSYDWGACRIQLNVRNLTDADYESRGFLATSVTPSRPLAAWFGFDYRF